MNAKAVREGKVLHGRQSIYLKNVLQFPLKSEQFLILTGKSLKTMAEEY